MERAMSRGRRKSGVLIFMSALVAAIGMALLLLLVSSTRAGSQDQSQQSAAFFVQMAPVFQHPRCMNCHTGEGFPRQGDDAHRHHMNVARGYNNMGAASMQCGTCHQSFNQAASGVPGAADWQLAPVRMRWSGLNAGELCRALLDPARGGLKPEQFVPHINTSLVRWAWRPGTDAHGRERTLPPMTHSEFVDLAQRWIASGAGCPP
jgi:hypothetical protein